MKFSPVVLVLIVLWVTGCAKAPDPTPVPADPAPPSQSATAEAPAPATATQSADPVPLPLNADADAEVNQAIDATLGEHAAYRKVFDQLQAAAAAGDKQGVASLVSFPLDATVDGKKKRIEGSAAFVANYDKILTPAIVQVINKQKFSDLMVSYRGVMLGQGEVWINGLCKDDECKVVDVRVIAIQPKSDLSP